MGAAAAARDWWNTIEDVGFAASMSHVAYGRSSMNAAADAGIIRGFQHGKQVNTSQWTRRGVVD